MAVTSKPRPKPEPKQNIDDGELDVVEVSRDWITRHGWPDRYVDLRALADAETEGFKTLRLRKGELAGRSWQQLDVAYFREGGEGQACLYAQCWRS